jgi:hypothetical protein
MPADTHSPAREGVLVGLLGGGAVALWWVVVDLLQGTPFATLNAFGQLFVEGNRPVAQGELDAGSIVAFLVAHFAMFAVLGIVLIRLVHLASERWELRMGLWLGIVLTTAWLAFHSYALAIYTRHALPWWATAVGALVGVATMLALAWRRHPALRRSFGAVPLADEVESPPASPGGPTHRT